jgi:hypothetical protein
MTEDEARRNFLVAKYNADRAHELELDKAAGRYEIAFMNAVVILNGAAITVVVANLEKLKFSMHPLGTVGFWAWLSGLCFGLLAGLVAYNSQKHYAGGFRNRRHVIGLALLGRPDNHEILLGILPKETLDSVDRKAKEHHAQAEYLWRVATGLGLSGLGRGSSRCPRLVNM